MRWLLAPLLALAFLIGPGAFGRTLNPQIWYNPHGPLDYLNMWTPDAPWQHAARKVDVLEIVHWWIDGATDAQILAMTDFAKRHHMKIDLEIEAIARLPTDTCGFTEGYTGPNGLVAEAATLKRLNVKVDIMTMDEPLYWGMYNSSPPGCGLAIPDLVSRIASNVSGIIALYPDIQLYTIEPVPADTNFPNWQDTFTSFRTQLAQAIGKQIRGIQLDVIWETPDWKTVIPQMYTYVHQQNMGLGVFMYGGFALSGQQWNEGAAQHFEEMEGVIGVVPDYAIFTTWDAYPQYNMPETLPDALTWLIDRYFRVRTEVQAQFVGQGASGKLTDDEGKPIAGATINGYVPGVDFTQPLTTEVIQAVVPSNAAAGLIGIRLNAECSCNGFNDVLVGKVQYQETQGGSSSYSFQYSPIPPWSTASSWAARWWAAASSLVSSRRPGTPFTPTRGSFR